jgi:hypothetical protein
LVSSLQVERPEKFLHFSSTSTFITIKEVSEPHHTTRRRPSKWSLSLI